jgi:hypothetical protein
MATLTRTNPAATTTDVETVGADLKFFTVDYINAVNGGAGPIGSSTGAQAAVLQIISDRCNIVAIGPLVDSNTQQTFAAEGEVNVATMQAAIRALANPTGGVNMSAATVTATKLGILTANVVT